VITVSAPGKLMLSGEWSILEKNTKCIVLAVQQRVYAKIQYSDEILVCLKDFDIESRAKITKNSVSFDKEDPNLIFTKYAIDTAINYIRLLNKPIKTFQLDTWGEINTVRNEETGQEMKVGFGSSAAAVVAIVSAVLQLHGISFNRMREKEVVFKLSIISHYLGQGKIGSGFDVAASTFGGVLVYKRFDPEWLHKNLQSQTLLEVVNMDWPLLKYEKLELPNDLYMMVGFTGTSASTKKLVSQMKLFKKEDPDSYFMIISRISDVTDQLIEAIRKRENLSVLKLLDQNRLLLEELSLACSCHLEITEHQIMSHTASKYGAVAKFSGAGGGDCSIGICFSETTASLIVKEWKRNGIMPIDIKFSSDGIREEERKRN
jgi:phosphomevalonate kinase